MRYIFLVLVLIGELMLAAAMIAGLFISCDWQVKALIIVLIVLAYNAWKEGGGFMPWQPFWIKEFLTRAKKIGL